MEEMEARHNPRLSQPEIDAIIGVAYGTRDRRGLREASRAVRRVGGRQRNRHTMERHFYLVLELIGRGLDTEATVLIDETIAEEIVDTLSTWDISTDMVVRDWQALRLWRASHLPDAIEDTGRDANDPLMVVSGDVVEGSPGGAWRDTLLRFTSWRFAAGFIAVSLRISVVLLLVVLFLMWQILEWGKSETPPPGVDKTVSLVRSNTAPPFPLSLSFDSWVPSEPGLTHIWDEVELSFHFTNTSDHPWEFFAAATLRKPDGEQDHLAPMRAVYLQPGEQGVARWTYTVEQIGGYDVIYGVWAFAEEGKEPEFRIGNNGWQLSHLVAYEGCPTTAEAKIIEYYPFRAAHVLEGKKVTRSMDFRNTGVVPRKFVVGASVVDTEENMVGNYDTVLETALLPGQIATAQWDHLVEKPGDYLVQFGVWERLHDGLVFRAPCPMERLILAHPPGMPLVDVVGLEVPTRGPGDQWITITGENFEPDSAVILKFIATEYPIDAERVKYENPNTIKVWESLTVAGTWQVQVVNSADESSNWLDFRVLP